MIVWDDEKIYARIVFRVDGDVFVRIIFFWWFFKYECCVFVVEYVFKIGLYGFLYFGVFGV